MDQKDEQILEIMTKNAKLTTQQISNKTGVPITTVHNRIKRLEKEGIIKRYTIEIDFEKIGIPINAMILISLDLKSLKGTGQDVKEMMKKIKSMPGVHRVFMVTGTKDIIVRIRAKDIKELDDILTNHIWKLENVNQTETMIITHEIQ